VCTGFKYDESTVGNIITKIDTLFLSSTDTTSTAKYIVDIFPQFSPSNDFVTSIKILNKITSNEQLKLLGKVITYVQASNFHGDIYAESREKQLIATKFWTSVFLSRNIDSKKLLAHAIEYAAEELNTMKQILK